MTSKMGLPDEPAAILREIEIRVSQASCDLGQKSICPPLNISKKKPTNVNALISEFHLISMIKIAYNILIFFDFKLALSDVSIMAMGYFLSSRLPIKGQS